MSDGIARFKDFTGDEGPITFQVGVRVFTARDDILLKHLGNLAEVAQGMGGPDAEARVLAVFEKLLEPDSFGEFTKAVSGEGGGTVGIVRLQKIVPWLLEQYGLRPTEASSGSGDTSSESGASLTDGASLAASTS